MDAHRAEEMHLETVALGHRGEGVEEFDDPPVDVEKSEDDHPRRSVPRETAVPVQVTRLAAGGSPCGFGMYGSGIIQTGRGVTLCTASSA